MLICNNCFSENPDGTIRCHQCNMAGDFTHKSSGDQIREILKVEKSLVQCHNCGNEAPGDGDKCNYCQFPLSKQQREKDSAFKTGTLPNAKTG